MKIDIVHMYRNLRIISVLLVLLTILGCHKTKKEETKKIYRDITELEAYKDFTIVSGEVLSNADKALTYVQKDSIYVLILEQIIKTNTSKVNYSMLDEVVFVAEIDKTEVNMTSCELKENHQNELIYSFIVEGEDEDFANVLKSWIIDLEKNEFQEIKSEKVQCYNVASGYDG